VTLTHDDESDFSIERVVYGGPALEVRPLRQPAAQGIAIPENNSWANA
jgi:hypothetical protein